MITMITIISWISDIIQKWLLTTPTICHGYNESVNSHFPIEIRICCMYGK